jgi:lysophospholipase L1-like esterase
MKKLTAILVALMMLLALAGCNAKKPAADTAATTATSEKGHQSDAEKARGYYYYEAIFLDKDEAQTLPKAVMPDLLHPSAEGHRRWAEAVLPRVKELSR